MRNLQERVGKSRERPRTILDGQKGGKAGNMDYWRVRLTLDRSFLKITSIREQICRFPCCETVKLFLDMV